ncbi:U3 small nucleolar RNA-interacting protein, putative [Entamoeba invadens IP1]|uniref:U3 small nucleolar RNA-interacting protein, putative n=1 Tax=Entamoeba invadens IP1 TaxID=370355 RepID=UPI0002C3E002|nr:U3 small nucleolar RNA-interacting protein, putative [Entamoeba invadens IP1]ELP93487.1 U3 small nucleolar RNA-interacting protein, putative [Entamoeba invadens IP1]|eukprot:XP_004260258.1 U3 small nucleolar RNA-interacting protein, putative [Entamoeba invadens IP1]
MNDPFLVPFKERIQKELPKKSEKKVGRIRTSKFTGKERGDLDDERLKQAKEHIKDTEKNVKQREDVEDEETKTKNVFEQIFQESLDKTKQREDLASTLTLSDIFSINKTRTMTQPYTSAIISPTDQTKVYFSSQDGKIMTYDITTNRFSGEFIIPETKKSSRRPPINNLTIDQEGTVLVAAASNKHVYCFDPKTNELSGDLRGHQDEVMTCCFREGTLDLFTSGNDRSIKMWNIATMGLMDTFYGHLNSVTTVDALSSERCLTASTDKTLRIFKVVGETQLVYNSHEIMDCAAFLDEAKFIAGSNVGDLSLFGVTRKTHIEKLDKAHKNGVSTIKCIRYSDAFFTGGVDGVVKFWSYKDRIAYLDGERHFNLSGSVQLPGCVNGIDVMRDNSAIVCAVGRRFRLGDWHADPSRKNGIAIIKLK